MPSREPLVPGTLNKSLWILLILHKTKVTLQNSPVLIEPFAAPGMGLKDQLEMGQRDLLSPPLLLALTPLSCSKKSSRLALGSGSSVFVAKDRHERGAWTLSQILCCRPNNSGVQSSQPAWHVVKSRGWQLWDQPLSPLPCPQRSIRLHGSLRTGVTSLQRGSKKLS